MVKKIPFILIYSRLVAGAIAVLLAWTETPGYRGMIAGLIVYGVVSDFFDGFIARRMGISTEHLRKADSTVDQFFWLAVIWASYIIAPNFYAGHWMQISLLAILEMLAYVICFVRFGKVVATHAIASKVWVLTLLFCLIEVVLTDDSGWLFQLCFWVGLVSRMEIIAMMLLIKEWVNDIPSLRHALQLRRGETIKRNKIFNG